MKKVLSLVLAAVMLFALSSAAFAADVELECVELNYDAIEEVPYEGDWFTVCEAFDMYLPVDWHEIELTEEDNENGVIMIYCDEAEEHIVSVGFISADQIDSSITTLDEMAEVYMEDYDDVTMYSLNGIPAFGYTDEEEDAFYLYLPDDEGNVYMIVFYPVSDEEFIDWIVTMIASVSVIGE